MRVIHSQSMALLNQLRINAGRNGFSNYLPRESNALSDEHRSQSFVDNSAFIGDSSIVSQCRLQMKYRDGGNARKRARRYSDKISKGGEKKNKGTSLQCARNKRPKQARMNQKRGTKRAGGLPERGWTIGKRESLRGTLAVSQVVRARAG